MTIEKPKLTPELFETIMSDPVRHYPEFQLLSDSEKDILRTASNLRIQRSFMEFYDNSKHQTSYWVKDGRALCAEKIQTYSKLIDEFFTNEKSTTA